VANKKIIPPLVGLVGLLSLLVGLIFRLRIGERQLFDLFTLILQRGPTDLWYERMDAIGDALMVIGSILLLCAWLILPRLSRIKTSIIRANLSFENFLDTRFSKYIHFADHGVDHRVRGLARKKISFWDGIAITIFFFFALLYFLGRMQENYPHILLTGDAGNIASFAAAWDQPESFQGDALLGNSDNIRIYLTLHIPLLRWLNQYTHSYSLAYTYLLGPNVFLHLLGFYTLGRVLFNNRYWAFLLSSITAMPMTLNLGEIWGLPPDVLPRFTFQALLPFVLALAYIWREQPRRWPWLLALAGGMIYLHPVSAPAWGLAIWLGLWLFLPPPMSLKQRILFMGALGFVFIGIAAPFVINYMDSHVQGKSPNHQFVYYIIENYFPPNLLDARAAFSDFLHIAQQQALYPLSLFGLALVWVLRRTDRKPVYLILTWGLGIALAAIMIPFFTQAVQRLFQMIPFETELVRSIRYFIPLMLLFLLWPLVELQQRFYSPWASRTAASVGLIMVFAWVFTHPPSPGRIQIAVTCLLQGQWICLGSSDNSLMLEYILEETSPGSKFFVYLSKDPSPSIPLSIRYEALRPVVYTYKDRGLLVYSNEQELTRWYDTYTSTQNLHYAPIKERLQILYDTAAGLEADYMLLDFIIPDHLLSYLPIEKIYVNSSFTLLKVNSQFY
jgi:hypothetical protein